MPNNFPILVGSGGATGWQRPDDWLNLPAISIGEEKIAILAAVFETGLNYVGFKVYCSGDFTVDWGDGNVETFSTSALAYHNYDYDDLDSSTFCTRGYRQAIITVTANTDETFSSFQAYTSPYSFNYTINQILDIHIEGSFSTIIFNSGGNGTARCLMLEQFESNCVLTSCNNMFYYCWQLRNLKNTLNTSNVEDFSYMFYACYNYNQSIEFDTTNGVLFQYMLYACSTYNQSITINAPNASRFDSFMSYCYTQSAPVVINENVALRFDEAFTACFCLDALDVYMKYCTNTGYIFGGSITSNMNYKIRKLHITMPASINYAIGYYFNTETVSDLRLLEMTTASNGLNFTGIQLDRSGLVQLFNDLPDRTGETSGSLTLSSAMFYSDLTAADLLIATNKNWSIIY